MVALRIRIPPSDIGDAENLLHERTIFESGGAHFSPVTTLAALDYVIDRGE
jgi:hypothetical protein